MTINEEENNTIFVWNNITKDWMKKKQQKNENPIDYDSNQIIGMREIFQIQNIKIKYCINSKDGIQIHLDKIDDFIKKYKNSGPRK